MFKASKAIIRCGNSFFLQLRDNVNSIPYPNRWAFFGGRLLIHEEPKDGLVREIKEELAIKIKVVEFIKAVNHAYSHFSITMYAFNCEFVNGTPTLNTCTNLQYIAINDFDKYPFPKANHKLFPYINQLELQV